MNVQNDVITMKDGKVVIVNDEGMRPMDSEVRLSDGTRVMPNGQMLLADGTARMLQEGENITIDRKPIDAEELSDRQFKEVMEDEEARDDLH